MKDRILDTVRKIEGLRDGCYHYEALVRRAEYIRGEFSSLGLTVERDELVVNGRTHWNVIATPSGIRDAKEWLLIGAHYDAVVESPGADDNASGVAVMLEVARALGPRKGLKYVAFTLEEPQADTISFLMGSRHFVKTMKALGCRYRAALILESVGYVSHERGSQLLPPFVTAPRVGDFIGVVGNSKAAGIMGAFRGAASRYVPDLKVVTHRAPMRGYIIPETRFSDHAPFWDAGYPAVMITDTAMFRNPHYHTPNDTSETLSPDFMAQVAAALTRTVEMLMRGKERNR